MAGCWSRWLAPASRTFRATTSHIHHHHPSGASSSLMAVGGRKPRSWAVFHPLTIQLLDHFLLHSISKSVFQLFFSWSIYKHNFTINIINHLFDLFYLYDKKKTLQKSSTGKWTLLKKVKKIFTSVSSVNSICKEVFSITMISL